jgi:ATP-dependent Clp protease ATP-binding subunit ClpC
VGYQPEFGARELKRRIRSEVETRVAAALLKGELLEGDSALLRYDKERGQVVIEKMEEAVTQTTEAKAPSEAKSSEVRE